MVEIVHDGRMPLGHTFIRSLVINEAAVIFSGDLFSFLFKSLKIAAVFPVVDLFIQRIQFRVFFGDKTIYSCNTSVMIWVADGAGSML
jgi:hypothetical protein